LPATGAVADGTGVPVGAAAAIFVPPSGAAALPAPGAAKTNQASPTETAVAAAIAISSGVYTANDRRRDRLAPCGRWRPWLLSARLGGIRMSLSCAARSPRAAGSLAESVHDSE
jgi:hypothetical protein